MCVYICTHTHIYNIYNIFVRKIVDLLHTELGVFLPSSVCRKGPPLQPYAWLEGIVPSNTRGSGPPIHIA